jgi:hypothetical protein
MNFTPQQLSGGIRFSSITKLGNWEEERIIEEQKAREVMVIAENARRSMNSKTSKLEQFMEPTPLSVSTDGKLRYGDVISLHHPLTNRYLSSDITNPVYSGFEKFLVSGALVDKEDYDSGAMPSRSCFVVTPPPSSPFQKGDIVRFEDPCLLETHGSILLNPKDYTLERDRMFLASARKDEVNATRLSNEQLVFMTSVADSQALWKILPSEESDALEESRGYSLHPSEIGQVPTGVPLFLMHLGTNLPLTASEAYLDLTDFGVETEVCCTATSLDVEERRGRRRTLERETGSRPQPSTLLQGSEQKKWVVLVSDGKEEQEEEEEELSRSMTVPDTEDLIFSEISFVLQFLVDRGILENSFFWNEALRRLSTNGKIDCEDLRFALQGFVDTEAQKEWMQRSMDLSRTSSDLHSQQDASSSIPTKHDLSLLIDYLVGPSFHPLVKIQDLRSLLEGMKEED